MNKLYLITGLPAVGKTTNEIKILNDNKINNFKAICFSRRNKEYLIEKSAGLFNEKNTFTLHSLCFQILKGYNKLPTEFKKEQQPNVELKNKDFPYKKLEDNFLSLDKQLIYNSLKDIDAIVLEEAQDFTKSHFNVIKRIVEVLIENDVKHTLIISGDISQSIYRSITKEKNIYDFENIRTGFAKYNYSIKDILLRKCYRFKNILYQSFINEYYRKYIEIPDGYLYLIDKPIQGSKNNIYVFNNKNEELNFIKKEVNKIDKSIKIAILGRTNNDLKRYKEEFSGYSNVEVNTIHKIKGIEAANIFLINFSFETSNDIHELKLLGVALTRATNKLIITTAQPFNKEKKDFFDEKYFNINNFQYKINKEKSSIKLKKIKENKNFSINKLKNVYIDSIDFKLNLKDAPYYKRIVNNDFTNNNKFIKKEKIKLDNGFNYTIVYNTSHRFYLFEFLDLKLLQKNGFSDKQIIQYLYNIIIEHFDFRISDTNKILVESIHLNKYFSFNNKNVYRSNYIQEISKLNNSKCMHYSVCVSEFNEKKYNQSINLGSININKNITFYFNRRKDYKKHLTVVLYNPNYKKNKNKINIKNVFKKEIRLYKNDFKLNYFKKYEKLSINDLLGHKIIKFKDLYEYSIRYFKY